MVARARLRDPTLKHKGMERQVIQGITDKSQPHGQIKFLIPLQRDGIAITSTEQGLTKTEKPSKTQ